MIKVRIYSPHFEEWICYACKTKQEVIEVLLHDMEQEGLIVKVGEE